MATLTKNSEAGQQRGYTVRRKTRVAVLQSLYELDSVGHEIDETLDNRIQDAGLRRSAEAFARKIVHGISENRDEIDSIILEFAPNWPIAQIAVVDRNILRMAIYEIVMNADVPPKVAVNEAVELAKSFASENAPKFVNGVLGSVMEKMEF